MGVLIVLLGLACDEVTFCATGLNSGVSRAFREHQQVEMVRSHVDDLAPQQD